MGKRKRDDNEPKIAPWVVTYGDMMSLLLTFFVLLLSFSSIQETKFHEAIGSLQKAMGVMNTSQYVLETKAPPSPVDIKKTHQQLRAQMKKIEDYLTNSGMEGNVEVEPTHEGFVVRLNNPLLFDIGSAEIKSEATELLRAIVGSVSELEYDLRVEGHTDDVPIHNSKFPSNWELSTTRALAVLKVMNAEGVSPVRLSAAGFGEFKPLLANDSDDNRARNRRVEIHVKTNLSNDEQETPWFLEEEEE